MYYRNRIEDYYFIPYEKGKLEGVNIVFGGKSSVDFSPNRMSVDYLFDGSDRYETSVKIAESAKKFIPEAKVYNIVLLSGENYPDALSAGPVTSYEEGLLLLTNKDKLNENTKKFIIDNIDKISSIQIIGGEGSVSKNVSDELKKIFEDYYASKNNSVDTGKLNDKENEIKKSEKTSSSLDDNKITSEKANNTANSSVVEKK